MVRVIYKRGALKPCESRSEVMENFYSWCIHSLKLSIVLRLVNVGGTGTGVIAISYSGHIHELMQVVYSYIMVVGLCCVYQLDILSIITVVWYCCMVT